MNQRQQMITAARIDISIAKAFNPGVFYEGQDAFFSGLDFEDDCPYDGIKAVYWYAGYIYAEECSVED